MNNKMKALIFGAKGSIGNYIFTEFCKENIDVIGTTSNQMNISENIILVKNDNLDNLMVVEPVDIVVWANGDNCNDNINTYNEFIFKKIIDANVTFILNTLHYLLLNNKVKNIILWIYSSAGESIRLISVKSVVQIHLSL